MATTDPTSPILYQKSHHEYPTINNITLEQVFEDGTSLKVKVPQYIPHEQGILFFLTETLPEFMTRTTNTLLYDGHDYFDHFPEVLDSSSRRVFQHFADAIPRNQHTRARFEETVFKFLQHQTGDEHFDTAFQSYLLGQLSDKPRKPIDVEPKIHRLNMDDLINAYNQIPTIPPLTEDQERTIHFRSYPQFYQDKYRTVHLLIQSVPELTSHMQNLHAMEARQAKTNKNNSRYYKRKAASEDSDSEASNQEEEPTKRTRKKQPFQRSRTHPNYSTDTRNQGQLNQYYLLDQRPCPVHCEHMNRTDPKWHTWWLCDLNPRGPNYKPKDTRTHTKQPNNTPTDIHYHDLQQQPQRQRNVNDTNRTTNTNINTTSTNNNDRHYLDMFGFPN